MNNYDEIKKLYDNSVIYNNEFINLCKDCKFNNIPKYNHFIKK